MNDAIRILGRCRILLLAAEGPKKLQLVVWKVLLVSQTEFQYGGAGEFLVGLDPTYYQQQMFCPVLLLVQVPVI